MNKLIAYTYSFLSFLTPKLEKGLVKNLILFGSVARNESTKDSDIDLFLEVYAKDKIIIVKKMVDLAIKNFTKSNIYKEWKLRGVSNEIKCLTGTFTKQSDLERSLISNGLILYGKYNKPIKGDNYALLSIKPIRDKNKRYRVLRKLFGRHEKKVKTTGLIKELGGEQLSTRVFIVPLEQAPIILKILRKEKIDYSMKEINS